LPFSLHDSGANLVLHSFPTRRSSDLNLFFSGGEGIQPEEVERVIAAHPAVLQVFIVPVADKEFGHRPVAVVEYDQQTVDLGEWVKDKLARFQQPVRWLTLPPELKNGGIKISRQALKEWVQRQQ